MITIKLSKFSFVKSCRPFKQNWDLFLVKRANESMILSGSGPCVLGEPVQLGDHLLPREKHTQAAEHRRAGLPSVLHQAVVEINL